MFLIKKKREPHAECDTVTRRVHACMRAEVLFQDRPEIIGSFYYFTKNSTHLYGATKIVPRLLASFPLRHSSRQLQSGLKFN